MVNRHFIRWAGAAAMLCLLLAGAACSRDPRQKALRHIGRGKTHAQNKDYPRAILEFRNAVQAAPRNAEAHYQLALAYLQSNDGRAAVAELQAASEADSTHVGARLKLAELMATSRREEVLELASQKVREVLTLSPDNPDALHVLAITELRSGKPGEAAMHLELALKKVPAHLASSITLARLKMAQKDGAGAEKVLQQAVATDPKSTEPLIVLARFYVLNTRHKDAEEQYRRALAIDPASGPALLDLGTLQLSLHRRDEAGQTFRALSGLPGKQYRPVHAMFLFDSGRHDEAIAEFRRLSDSDPKDREARNRLVLAYLGAKRIPDAEKVLADYLSRNPKDTDALEQRARIHLATGRAVEAEKDLQEVLGAKPDSAQAHYLLAKTHQARNAHPAYKQELGEALKLNPALLAARIEFSQALRRSRGAKTAMDLLDKVPPEQKDALPVLVERNWVLYDLGDEARMREGVDLGLKQGRFPELLLQDAAFHLRRKNYAAAQRSIEEALRQNPADLRALEMLGRSYVAQQQVATSILKIREYAAKSPRNAAVQHFLGTWLANAKDNRSARSAFTAAREADPKFIAADLSLAQLDVAEGNRAAARQTLDRLLRENHKNSAARFLLGMVEELDGNRPGSIEAYRKVVAAEPDNVIATNNLAYLLADFAKQPDEALRLAQLAKEAAPEASAIDDTIGWAYYQKGIYPSAVAHLESAVKRGATALRTYHLAMAYHKAGKTLEAQKQYQAGLRLDPRLPEAQTARQVLSGQAN